MQHVIGWFQHWGRTGECPAHVIEYRMHSCLAICGLMRKYEFFRKNPSKGLMPLSDIPCFENLPNLWDMLCDSLQICALSNKSATKIFSNTGRNSDSASSSYNLIHHCFMMALPCQHQTNKHLKPDEYFSAMLNVVQATLFGMYPANTRKPHYIVRIEIFERISSLHTAKQATRMQFLQRCNNLITLAFMEYIAQVAPQAWPVEHSVLMSDTGVAHWMQKIPLLCDDFRMMDVGVTLCDDSEPVEIDSLCRKQTNFINWDELDKAAQARIRKCCRTRRVGMLQSKKALVSKGTACDVSVFLNCPVLYRNTRQEMIDSHSRSLMSHALNIPADVLHHGHSLVQVFELPANIKEKQITSLVDRYDNNYIRYICTRLFVCMHCLYHRNLVHSKFRTHTLTGNITCSECLRDDVISVDVLGRVVIIQGSAYVLCPCCCKVHMYKDRQGKQTQYKGSWLHFCPEHVALEQRNHYHGISRKGTKKPGGELYSSGKHKASRCPPVPCERKPLLQTCYVCQDSSKHGTCYDRINHLTGIMENIFFCYKHNVSEHDADMCVNMRQMQNLRHWQSRWMARGRTVDRKRLVYDH